MAEHGALQIEEVKSLLMEKEGIDKKQLRYACLLRLITLPAWEVSWWVVTLWLCVMTASFSRASS